MKLLKVIPGLLLICCICACRQTRERAEPLKYLTISQQFHTNLIGQTVIEGSINNKAIATTYKDIKVQIDYLSETNAVISTEDKMFYVYIKPKLPFYFKIKTNPPDQTSAIHMSITNAAVQ